MKKIDKSALLLLVAAGALAGCGGGGSGPGGGFVPSQGADAMPASTAAASADATAASAVEPAADKEAEALSKLDASWIKVANEGQTLNLPTLTVVQYGANSSWTSKNLSGTVACHNATFGDPLQFVAKACYVQTPTPTPTPTPMAGAGTRSWSVSLSGDSGPSSQVIAAPTSCLECVGQFRDAYPPAHDAGGTASWV